jgi:hypothetical protein
MRKLNLARNKFTQFHAEELIVRSEPDVVFPYLEELNFGFNIV